MGCNSHGIGSRWKSVRRAPLPPLPKHCKSAVWGWSDVREAMETSDWPIHRHVETPHCRKHCRLALILRGQSLPTLPHGGWGTTAGTAVAILPPRGPRLAPASRPKARAAPAPAPAVPRTRTRDAETEGETEAVGVFSNTGVSHQGARQGRERSGGTTVAATQSYPHSTAVRSSQNPHCQCGQGHTLRGTSPSTLRNWKVQW